MLTWAWVTIPGRPLRFYFRDFVDPRLAQKEGRTWGTGRRCSGICGAFVLPLVRLQIAEGRVAGIGEALPLLVVVKCAVPSSRVIEVAQLFHLSTIIISQLFTCSTNLDFYSGFRIVFSFRFHSSTLNR
jgi:hypothetical protein